MSCFSSPIVDSFQDAVVLLTGGTGYVGSGVLEKLLRGTPNLKKIYLIIRSKNNKTVEERLDELFKGLYWETLKGILPNFKKYVKIISGDLLEEGIGLSECDKEEIMAEVTHIFHLAATVRFNEKLKKAVAINIMATKFIFDLALNSPRLKSVVHVSTAYAHCYLPDLTERFYDPITNLDEFLKLSHSKTESELDDLTPSIIGEFPNTYTFTKSMCEAMIQKYEHKLPISIVRPAIVMGSWQEPLLGWVDSLFGPIGMLIGTGMGVIHVLYLKSEMVVDVVPLDMTANCIVAASWKNCNINHKKNQIPIFNFVSNKRNPVTWKMLGEWCRCMLQPFYSTQAMWACFYIETSNKKVYKYLDFFLHKIPGHLVDTTLQIMGKKPFLLKIYNKLDTMQDMLNFFVDRQWAFDDEKTVELFKSLDNKDKILYNFDITKIEWELYIVYFIRMFRIHILKDPISTIPAGRKKGEKLKIIHNSLLFFSLLILFLIVYYLFNAIFF